MRRSIMLGTTVLAVALSLVGCASSTDKVSDACSDVKDVASALPTIAGNDGAAEIMPMLDKELAAATTAAKNFQDAGANAAFRAAWQHMIGALQDDRNAWQDPLTGINSPGGPGSDSIAALNLAGYKDKVDEAKTALDKASGQAGYPECGNTIAWRY